MGNGVPLINEYKQEFLWKRLPQTFLGGPKLRLGYEAPCYVYFHQVLIFILPWILGGIFSILVELDILQYDIAAYVYGALIFIMVLVVNITSVVSQTRNSAVLSVHKDQQNTLAEDDEVDFESCCAIETVSFVIPGKKFKFNIVVHSLLSGAVCGLGLIYLLPVTLNGLYSNSVPATVMLFIFGWFTLLVGQYSLTVGAPPEFGIFRPLDTLELIVYTRPFYLLAFFSFDLLARTYTEFVIVNQYLHVIFIFLPLFWTLGTLPPLDALWNWACEQALIHLFGGSAMASDLRLLIMLLVSTVSFVIVYFIPSGVAMVALMAAFGYLLSLDWGSLGGALLAKRQVSPGVGNVHLKQPDGFLWGWGGKEVTFHIIMLVVVCGLSGGLGYVATTSDLTSYADYLGYVAIALFVIQGVLADIQRVYVLGGLWRNKLYPRSVQRVTIFQKGKKRLNILGYIHRIINGWVAPYVMLMYLIFSVPISSSASPSVGLGSGNSAVGDVLGAHRAFRWVWQSTSCSLFEVSVLHILRLALPSSSTWLSQGVGLQLLLLSLARDRLQQIVNKLYFVLTTLVMSWCDKKQRRSSTGSVITLNIVFFPIVLMVVVVASALAAPLLPLFTLPMFLIGYPRVLRSWPEPVGASANTCPDTVYYEQFASKLIASVRTSFANGSLGSVRPGEYLLVRFQDRLVWVSLLERGYAYVTLSIKGLELQETSCHTVEAARIDDIYETSFEIESKVSCCHWNKYPLCTLHPYDAALIQTYSDAKNVLTGVIDSPESLKAVATGFTQTLVWVILHHVVARKKKKASTGDILLERPVSARSIKSQKIESWKKLSESKSGSPSLCDAFDMKGHTNKGVTFNEDDLDKSRSRPSSRHKTRSPSIASFGSTWSDDNESLILETIDKKKVGVSLVQRPPLRDSPQLTPVEEPIVSYKPSNQTRNVTSPLPGALNTNNNANGDDDVFGDLDFGLPAMDIHQKKQIPSHPVFAKKTGGTQVTLLDESDHFASIHSHLVNLPLKWRGEIPIPAAKLEELSLIFPIAWFRHVLSLLELEADGKPGPELVEEISKDQMLEKLYNKFVMACYAVVNVLGLSGAELSSLGAHHVYKVYSEDIPWSPSLSFLTDDQELFDVVLKAYRYAVKLSIDQALLGEVSSFEELQEYLQEYDADWYIGLDSDPMWAESVIKNTPNLFSFGHNPVQSTYHSRLLSQQDVVVYMGSVNAEAVRGQWANLTQELLYMTNDDEERYSIQAHPTLLRNLTVQAADPPLGYPVYASLPTAIPTL